MAGFDGIPPARQSRPRLTTVDVPSVELGRRAVDMLLATGRDGQLPPSEVLPVQLIVGESTPPRPVKGLGRGAPETVSTRPGGAA
jgi:DNA-binding LacI/PurR family transcriptional regulator